MPAKSTPLVRRIAATVSALGPRGCLYDLIVHRCLATVPRHIQRQQLVHVRCRIVTRQPTTDGDVSVVQEIPSS